MDESQKQQTISWNQEFNIQCGDENEIKLNAKSDSGLYITYEIEDSSVAVIENNTLKFISKGVTKIKATQQGNNIYEKAKPVTKTISKTEHHLLVQHWEDMLFFDNSSKKYVAWQWYENGKAIEGATEQSYQSLILSGSYYVVATTRSGKQIRTCSLEVYGDNTLERTGIKVYPNPVRRGSNFTVKMLYKAKSLKSAKITLYDITGKLLQTKEVSSNKETLIAPNSSGIYIVRLLLSDGRSASKNVLVN